MKAKLEELNALNTLRSQQIAYLREKLAAAIAEVTRLKAEIQQLKK